MIAPMSIPRRTRLLVAGVVSFVWLPLIATFVVAGFAFGWRVPLAVVAGGLLMYGKARLEVWRFKTGEPPIGWPLQMIVFAALGATLGGIALGGVGVIFGVVIGVVLGLPPLSVRNKEGLVTPFDPTDSVQREQIDKSFGLLLMGLLVVMTVVILIAVLLERFA
jgi:membrane protease YdiL (CAAX protease family)